MIEDNFFKWFYCEENQKNIAVNGKSEMKWGVLLVLFFFNQRLCAYFYVNWTDREEKEKTILQERGVIKKQNPWEGTTDGIQNKSG